MNKIIEILMRRDNISYLEAQNILDDVREEIFDVAARGNYIECEDILASELGLEPDYLDFIL